MGAPHSHNRRTLSLYAAVYDEVTDAEADYAVFDLHAAGALGTFDSAVISSAH